jgi:hypothetical protein
MKILIVTDVGGNDQLVKCSDCGGMAQAWRNMYIAYGIECRQCGASTGAKKTYEDALSEWTAMNTQAVVEELPSELFHEQYGLTPEAIVCLRTLFEFGKPQLEVLDRLGMEKDMVEKTASILAWLIEQHTDYPEQEMFMLNNAPVKLMRGEDNGNTNSNNKQ